MKVLLVRLKQVRKEEDLYLLANDTAISVSILLKDQQWYFFFFQTFYIPRNLIEIDSKVSLKFYGQSDNYGNSIYENYLADRKTILVSCGDIPQDKELPLWILSEGKIIWMQKIDIQELGIDTVNC